MSRLDSLGLGRPELRAWAMYDWANSAFATTVMAAFLPIYYSTVAAAELGATTATAYWGYTTAIALALVAVLSPVLGAIADYMGAKKRFLAVFMSFGVTFTALLWFIGAGTWMLASAIFIVANVGFAGANVFYEALLSSSTTTGLEPSSRWPRSTARRSASRARISSVRSSSCSSWGFPSPSASATSQQG
jgi:UMF1 family MFS transporter